MKRILILKNTKKQHAERKFEKTDYRNRRYKEEKNICSYKRKSKLDNHAYEEKVYNGKLNVFVYKDKTNYKKRKKRNSAILEVQQER